MNIVMHIPHCSHALSHPDINHPLVQPIHAVYASHMLAAQ